MIEMKMKSLFFDTPKVILAVDKAKRRVLGKSGAVIRTIAKRSMRAARMYPVSEMPEKMRERYKRSAAFAKKRGQPRPKRPKAPSKPGEPPRVRRGLLKKLLYYAWDPTRLVVVVGPEGFKGRVAPRALEEGGQSTIPVWTGRGRLRDKSVRIKPRPYMGPALAKERRRMAKRWRDSVRG